MLRDQEGTETESKQLTDQEIEDQAFLEAMAADDDYAPLKSPEATESDDTDTEDETEDPGQDTEEESEGAESKPVRDEVFEGFTAEELRNHLAEIPKLQKQLDRVNGNFGQRFADTARELEALRNRPTAQAASKLSPDAFKRLKEEFPELGSLLAEELQEAMVVGGPGFNPADFKAQIDEGMTAYERKVQAKSMKRLVKKFPDWEQVAGYQQDEATGFSTWNNEDFGNWVSTQPIEVQQDITTTDDPLDLLEYLNDFNEAKKNSGKQSPTVPSVPVTKKSSKQVFGKAIKPKSTTGAEKALTDKEEEDRAFREAMMDESF